MAEPAGHLNRAGDAVRLGGCWVVPAEIEELIKVQSGVAVGLLDIEQAAGRLRQRTYL